MAYIASIHKASSVRHAVQANFLDPEEQSLIVAKSNRVEIYSFNSSPADQTASLTLHTTFTVYGQITVLLTLRPETSPTDHLFFATDCYDYFTISWDQSRQTIRNERLAKDLSDRFLRHAKYGAIYLSDPKTRMLGLHIYQGIFTVIPLIQHPQKSGKRGPKSRPLGPGEAVGDMYEPVPIRLQELKVVDMAFLDTPGDVTLGMLYEDPSDIVHLKVYRVKTGGKGKGVGAELEEVELQVETKPGMRLEKWEQSRLDAASRMLIPVPEDIGGMLIIGEQTAVYYNQATGRYKKRPLPDPTVFSTWGKMDEQIYLLGDDYGKLYILQLVLIHELVVEIKFNFLGKISTPSRLVHLSDGLVYVGSHLGDAQLIRVELDPPSVTVLQTFSNLAPVIDFRILDMGYTWQEQHHLYSSGQTRIISGSGAFHDGSLRSLRSGVGLEDLGILGEMEGIRGLWGLKSNPQSEYQDILLVSFIDESRVFQFSSEGDVEELDSFKGFSFTEGVLTAANVHGGRLLQVTPSSAILTDAISGDIVTVWRPALEHKISLASANDEALVIATSGSEVILFDLKSDMIEAARRTFPHEVASLYIPASPTPICLMGSWTTSNVTILALPNFNTLLEGNLGDGGGGVVPRSLFLGNILENQPPTLMVAMGDGRLFTYTYNPQDHALSNKKNITLGIQPVYLEPIPAENGLVNVFATSDHPSLIYGSQGRIVYSAVTVKAAEKATFVTPFHAEAFPKSVVAASDISLKITVVDPLRTTHIQTLPIGDVVRRVSHSKEHRCFGIVTIKLEVDDGMSGGQEMYRSFMKIVDDTRFEVIDSVELDDLEFVEAVMCAKLENGDGGFEEKFIVGSGFQNSDDSGEEPKRGKMRVFEVVGTEGGRKLREACALDIRNGACKCIDMVGGRIVAALQKTVAIYTYTHPNTPSQPEITNLSSFRVQSEPIDLSVYGNIIAVGDMMKGVVLLECDPESGMLTEVARNYSTQWTTAVCLLDGENAVSADAEGNIVLQKWDRGGVTPEDRRRLQITGEMRLAEMVNRFRKTDEHISPPSTTSITTPPTTTTPSAPTSAISNTNNTTSAAIVTPRLYLATVEGSIYLLGLISPSYTDLLLKLQSNLSRIIKGVGDLDFNRFRAYSTTERKGEEPFRFVDGDFIERFLELPEEVAEEVVKGAGVGDDLTVPMTAGTEGTEGWMGVGVEEIRGILENLRRLH